MGGSRDGDRWGIQPSEGRLILGRELQVAITDQAVALPLGKSELPQLGGEPCHRERRMPASSTPDVVSSQNVASSFRHALDRSETILGELLDMRAGFSQLPQGPRVG